MVKLNLGAGGIDIPGYTALDIKTGHKVYPLHYPNDSVDEIRASHVLEHFSHRETLSVLADWVRTLKAGGVLKIAVPDFGYVVQKYAKWKAGSGEKINAIGYVMGGHVDADDHHGMLFDKETLYEMLSHVGLSEIRPWKSEVSDCAALPVSLNLQGVKYDGPAKPQMPKVPETKITAVMSMPRLAFTQNLFSAMRAVLPLGIKLEHGCGVFWGQILTRLFERHLDDGSEYILTLDYDTWFTRAHVVRLMQLIVENPDIDAVVSVQIGRGAELPLVGKGGPGGERLTTVPYTEFTKPLTDIVTGHFGLTVFRVSALLKMEKPWFLPVPDPNGSWGEGRQDEDIYFWNNFARSGNKACMANEVFIGHMQQLCTFPGLAKDNWKPIHMHMQELEDNGPPVHCEPKVEYRS